MGEERYSQEQVAAILKRSAEIEGEKLKNAPAAALSLGDLEQIAEESGLDPASVRTAARELASADEPRSSRPTLPSPTGAVLHLRRDLEGELDDAELEQVLQSVGPRVNLPGIARRDGQGWRWHERSGRQPLVVRADSRHGRTSLELDEDLRPLERKLTGGLMAALGSFGIAFGFGFGANVEQSIAGALIFASLLGAVAFAGGFALSRFMFGRKRMARELRIQRLAGELERELRARIDAAAPGKAAGIPDEERREGSLPQQAIAPDRGDETKPRRDRKTSRT